MLIISNSI